MDETTRIPDPAEAGDLRSVHVRTTRYVFELSRAADGSTRTTFTPITETTPDRRSEASTQGVHRD